MKISIEMIENYTILKTQTRRYQISIDGAGIVVLEDILWVIINVGGDIFNGDFAGCHEIVKNVQ